MAEPSVLQKKTEILLVLLGVAKNQKYITQKKLLELQGKLEEIGRIIGGLQKFFINNRK